MKLHKKTALALSVASLLAGSAGSAFAAVQIGFGGITTEPVPFAQEQDAENAGNYRNFGGEMDSATDIENGKLSIQFPVFPGFQNSDVQKMFIAIGLTNGAKFATEPLLACAGSGFDGNWSAAVDPAGGFNANGGSARPFSITPDSAGLNQSIITYSIPADLNFNAANSGCMLFASAYSFKNEDVTFSATLKYTDAGALEIATRKGKFVEFVPAGAGSININGFSGGSPVNSRVVVDVAKDSTEFDDATKVGPRTALLGSITYDLAGTTIYQAVVSTTSVDFVVELGDILSSVTLTVKGEPLIGASNVFIADVADGCSTPGLITAGNGTNTVIITGITPAAVDAGINVCMEVDGATFIEEGQITLSLSGVGQTNWIPIFPPETDTVLVRKNGSSMVILNIPNSNLGDQGFYRFYNSQNRDATVRGTLYGQDGTVLGGPIQMAVIPENSVTVLSVPAIESLFGAAPWAGRAWLRLNADIDPENFRVQALIRNTNGTLINVSGQALQD